MSRCVYFAVILVRCLMLMPHCVHGQPDHSFSLSISSGEPLLPCVYRGLPYLHGEEWNINECTTCSCHNTTSTCVVISCQPAFCFEPLKPEGECCIICPYSMSVYQLRPSVQNQFEVSSDGNVSLVLAVEIDMRGDAPAIDGDHLWTLAAWIAPYITLPPHGGLPPPPTRIGFSEQVLNDNQKSQSYRKGKRFVFRDIIYEFNAPTFISSFNCSEQNSETGSGNAPEVCVQLKKGPEVDTRPFDLLSRVHSAFDDVSHGLHPYPFMGCTSICPGPDITPCSDSTGIHLHEDIWQQDQCTECICNNGLAECSSPECPHPDCRRPLKLEGECCLSCPYHVRVRKVTPLIMTYGLVGYKGDNINIHLTVPIKFHESNHTTQVQGSNLWTLSAWIALDQSNNMERLDYVDQILSDTARSQTHQVDEEFVFEDLDFRIIDPGRVCGSVFLICVQFDMDSDYETEHERGFELSGLPDNSSLIGCGSDRIPDELCNTLNQTGTINNVTGLSCEENGRSYIHGEQWKLDDCTTCDCDNTTITCQTEQCQPTHCEDPIKHPGECCYTCGPKTNNVNRSDVCVPLLISVVILAMITIFVFTAIIILRRRKMAATSDDNDVILNVSYDPAKDDIE